MVDSSDTGGEVNWCLGPGWQWRRRGLGKGGLQRQLPVEQNLGVAINNKKSQEEGKDEEFHFGWIEVQVGKLDGEYLAGSCSACE